MAWVLFIDGSAGSISLAALALAREMGIVRSSWFDGEALNGAVGVLPSLHGAGLHGWAWLAVRILDACRKGE